MCYKETKPRYEKKDFIAPPQDPDVVVYYREIGKKDVKCFKVAEYEDAFVVCPKGEIRPVEAPGFYEVVAAPAKVIWIRSARFIVTVGVPMGCLPGGFGIHADLALYLRSPETIIRNLISVGKEGKIMVSDIRDELRRILENAVRNLQIDPKTERKKVVELIHREMNNLIVRSWLGGFYCDVQSVGFSFECDLSKLVEELAG